jgi:uracil-DNA glycosylase
MLNAGSFRRGGIEPVPHPTQDPEIYADIVGWIRCVREYLEHQARCGTTGLPRDPLVTHGHIPTSPALSEPPASLAPAEPAQRVDVPVPTLNRLSNPRRMDETEALHVLTQAERTEKLAMLQQSIVGCTRCRLHEQRTQTVFARGTGSCGLCFIGEGPGADEDAQGFPFVGKAGQLLDRMISAMGLSRDEVYVCNIVKCRPPDNRKPASDEMTACTPFLERQLELLGPEVIVALGATAVEGLLGITEGITRMRGKWKLYRGSIPVMPTFHPAYLLRNPSAKHPVWEDMREVLRHMGRPVPERAKG